MQLFTGATLQKPLNVVTSETKPYRKNNMQQIWQKTRLKTTL